MTAVVTSMIPKCRPKFSLGLPPRLLDDVTVVSVTPVSYSAPLFPGCSQGPTPTATTPILRPIFGANLVAPHVFVGAAVDACDLKTLQEHDIRYVLNLAAECQPDPAVVAGVHHLHVPLADTVESQADARARFDDIYAFIQRGVASGHNVLVHCFLGLSRGPTAALAYITAEAIARGDRCSCSADVLSDDRPRSVLYSALAAMQATRANVLPNAGFMEALADWCRTRALSHAAVSDDTSSCLTRAETLSIDKAEMMSRTATAVGMTAERTLSMHSYGSY